MKARGIIFGLIIFVLTIGVGAFLPSCTLKDSTDEITTQQGNSTTTEKKENIEVDLEPEKELPLLGYFEGL